VDGQNACGDGLSLLVVPADGLAAEWRGAIIALCTQAFEEDFADLFALLPHTTHVLALRQGVLVGHACWVTRWLQPDGLAPLRTAYVEAVAVAPARQRRGIGSVVMRRLAAAIARYEVGALSPTYSAFYEGLGWTPWHGPTAIRTTHGLVATPEDEIMILRTPSTPALDVGVCITAEWREGELW